MRDTRKIYKLDLGKACGEKYFKRISDYRCQSIDRMWSKKFHVDDKKKVNFSIKKIITICQHTVIKRKIATAADKEREEFPTRG